MEPAWERIAESKFRLGTYKDANEQLRPCYLLTKTECLYIATKFNDEARAKLGLCITAGWHTSETSIMYNWAGKRILVILNSFAIICILRGIL